MTEPVTSQLNGTEIAAIGQAYMQLDALHREGYVSESQTLACLDAWQQLIDTPEGEPARREQFHGTITLLNEIIESAQKTRHAERRVFGYKGE